ncbi:hypothetical protein Q5O24_06480 [Eubacteriaceae bacterium ES3]|nr:hypothetical protein Q5O24_06480 [Eubacteriaceae bacterium ES3]
MTRKKVVLFLVEGITDQVSMGLVLTRLLKNRQVHFEITEGDLTSRDGTTSKNIEEKIWHQIKVFMGKKRYNKHDIQQVIHLIDTDGAFVPDSAVVPTDRTKTHYSKSKIYARDCQAMILRNHLKKEIVTRLHNKKEIAGIPYQIYYFSRNLEHALHNQIDELSNSHKKNLAEQLEDHFYEHPYDFIKILNRKDLKITGNYQQTWKYIKYGYNSLHRGSNFHLYFKNIKKQK